MFLPADRAHASPGITFLSGALILIGALASVYVYILVDHDSRAHILDRVETVAALLGPESVASLSGSEADLADASYQRTKERLVRVRESNPDARFVYLIGQSADGTQFFYADSESEVSPDYSPPGQSYEEATPPMHDLFADGKSRTEGVSGDRWGLWISGYAPVTADDGTVVALIGMDLPAYAYLFSIGSYSALPLLIALMLVLLIWLGESGRRKEAEALAQKGEFLSIASHEIRTPIVGIRWALETLVARGQEKYDARTYELLTLAHDTSVGVIGRIGNLLAAPKARPERRERVLLHALVSDILASVALSARSKDLTFIVDESVARLAAVHADRELTYQALFNIIGNAVKYTKPRTRIEIRGEEDERSVALLVTDHGAGIPKEEQELIFAGYHRTEAAKRSGQPGTGLGLYMTKRIVESLGGSISVESASGSPTVFTLTLPK